MPSPSILPYSQEWLLERFRYAPETGELFWRDRPRSDFSSDHGFGTWCRNSAGRLIVGDSGESLIRVAIVDSLGKSKKFSAHAIIWKMVKGEDATTIRHLNRDNRDNRMVNLALKKASSRPVGKAPNKRTTQRPNKSEDVFSLPPKKYLEQCMTYSPESGEFVWNRRPVEHFYDLRASRIWNTRFAGKSAGSAKADGGGYLLIRLDGTGYKAHRLAVKMMTGEDPVGEVDHVNRIRLDNRWENIRCVSSSRNSHNRGAQRNSTTYTKGVYRLPGTDRWRASIQVEGKQMHLGHFDTFEEAVAARTAANRKYGVED